MEGVRYVSGAPEEWLDWLSFGTSVEIEVAKAEPGSVPPDSVHSVQLADDLLVRAVTVQS